MTSAYDLNDLLERLKARGLDLAENEVKGVIEDVFAWLEESINESPTPFDNVALAVLPTLKKAALGLADKIDGKVG